MSNFLISLTFSCISGGCQAAERAHLPSCAWMTSPEVLMRLHKSLSIVACLSMTVRGITCRDLLCRSLLRHIFDENHFER